MTASNNVVVDDNRDTLDDGHCNGRQWPLGLLAMAAVPTGDGSCNGRQQQAKATDAMATATAGNNSK